ncbi:MAG: PRC-barrel domain-containing protein [Pseudomonadota bacterium]|nr:PRC-barrel domain-containing protein [Pseudomonadota bacterium]
MAGWIAPVATILAAMMTAANLGARVTGWGFVVFAAGSICWSIVAIGTGQTNLLASNGVLTVINFIGIWRWLGRQRSYEDGAKSATVASRRSAVPTLFTATGIAGMPVEDRAGQPLGKAVEALLECATGKVSYVVVASGGVGGIDERLRAVPHDRIQFGVDKLRVTMTQAEFTAIAILAEGNWPARAGPAPA